MNEQFKFLIKILKVIYKSKGDPKVVYPLLEANLDRVDYRLTYILKSLRLSKLSEAEPEKAISIAMDINYFSTLIQMFPLGNKATNIEIAIAGYKAILKIFTKKDFPYYWATTQGSLGIAYIDRIEKDRAGNLENAINFCIQALTIFTKKDFPYDWAKSQVNLSVAYLDKIKGDRADNLENAIEFSKQALTIITKKEFPYEWAAIQNNLSIAHLYKIKGDRADNLENAINFCTQALTVFTRKDFPYKWAMAQINLGNVYIEKIKGDRKENLEKAINAYTEALENLINPIDLATVQNNLGIAYLYRIKGDRKKNVEDAIVAFKKALTIRTREKLWLDRAKTLENLGNAYMDRIEGDKSRNIEDAINAYTEVLHTQENFPIDWATTQNNLGTAYMDRIEGDKAENIKNAILAFKKALEIRTKENFPIDWAITQNNLGLTYTKTIRDNKTENLEKAIAAFEKALKVRTLNAHPINHLTTSRNLGNLYFKQDNWQLAIPAYEKAVTAVELIRSWSKDDDRRQEILAESIDIYQNIIQCFINLKQYDKAIEYAERSRSRMVTELMASKDLYPNAEILPQLLEEYYQLQQHLYNLRRSTSEETLHGTSLPVANSRFHRCHSREEAEQKLMEIEKTEAKRQQVWREIRKSDPVLAGQLQVDSLSIQQMQALIKDEETAVLSFYTTKDNTYIFIVIRQDVQLFTCEGQGIEVLQNWIFDNWLIPYIDYRNEENREWRKNMGAFLQQLSQRLQLNQLITQHLSDIKELIIVPHLALHQIPFAALPVNIQGTSVVGEIPPTPVEEEIPPTPLERGAITTKIQFPPYKGGREGDFTRDLQILAYLFPVAKKRLHHQANPKHLKLNPPISTTNSVCESYPVVKYSAIATTTTKAPTLPKWE